jgi:hypothetical protein
LTVCWSIDDRFPNKFLQPPPPPSLCRNGIGRAKEWKSDTQRSCFNCLTLH